MTWVTLSLVLGGLGCDPATSSDTTAASDGTGSAETGDTGGAPPMMSVGETGDGEGDADSGATSGGTSGGAVTSDGTGAEATGSTGGDSSSGGPVGTETGDEEGTGTETGEGETGEGETGEGETGKGETGQGETGEGETGQGETGESFIEISGVVEAAIAPGGDGIGTLYVGLSSNVDCFDGDVSEVDVIANADLSSIGNTVPFSLQVNAAEYSGNGWILQVFLDDDGNAVAQDPGPGDMTRTPEFEGDAGCFDLPALNGDATGLTVELDYIVAP